MICTNQGRELACSTTFRTKVFEAVRYIVEPTGADSALQNSRAEKWNHTLAVTTRVLLYGAGLPAKYWSAALLHAAYVHNRRIHALAKITPFEGWFGRQPNLKCMQVFGSRVCVCQTGDRQAKLDHHHFDRIFIGFTATDQNIRYICVTFGVVKRSHPTAFDEAWYLQPSRPPAAQLLYDLGLENDAPTYEMLGDPLVALYPPTPCLMSKGPDKAHPATCHLHLPLWESSTPHTYGTCVATVTLDEPFRGTAMEGKWDTTAVNEFRITSCGMEQVFFSPTAYNDAFKEYLDMKCFYPTNHLAGGMHFTTKDNRLILQHMAQGSPCARLGDWRSRLKEAWLISVNKQAVSLIHDINRIIDECLTSGSPRCTLLFSHPDIRQGLTNKGILKISLDQLNPHMMFHGFTLLTPSLCNLNCI